MIFNIKCTCQSLLKSYCIKAMCECCCMVFVDVTGFDVISNSNV